MEDLRREIPADPTQYGGLKGCSVDHLLADLLDEVLAPLDEGNPSVITSIDFEKAFNRLDHGKCLDQLRSLGASSSSVGLVRSFLTNRQMRVKLAGTLGPPKALCGGSPQGSILGCLLYCLATQQLTTTRRGAGPPSRQTPPTAPAPPPPGDHDQEPDDAGLGLMPATLQVSPVQA